MGRAAPRLLLGLVGAVERASLASTRVKPSSVTSVEERNACARDDIMELRAEARVFGTAQRKLLETALHDPSHDGVTKIARDYDGLGGWLCCVLLSLVLATTPVSTSRRL